MKTPEYEGDKSKVYSDNGRGETFAEILGRRFKRRDLLTRGAAVSTLALAGPVVAGTLAQDQPTTPAAVTTPAAPATPAVPPAVTPPMSVPPAGAASTLTFTPIALSTADTHEVAAGYTAIPFLRWGDPITASAPDFDVNNQTAEAQAQQMGYNCDWIGYFPVPDAPDRAILAINHEYTNPELMFPGYLTVNPDFVATPHASPVVTQEATPVVVQEAAEATAAAAVVATPVVGVDIPQFIANPTQQIVDIELEAHGLTIVEVARNASGAWELVRDSPYNRRVTGTTPMDITGPAAGTEHMMTSEDPTGTRVLGTLNNCAGGTTPWGTIVTGEENFQQYFANLDALDPGDPVYAEHERFGINEGSSDRQWEDFYPRFDLAREPHEPFRFGWGVEIDPFDPASTPKKRTALGRNKHEGHTSFVAPGGQVAIYSGDDEGFEYAYKFVTAGSFNPDDRAANMNLLDDGTLYVAKFNDDGTGEWIPLLFEEGELTPQNRVYSQADILINTRYAADVVGATKMDRPEDFETNPVTGKVYLVCTNNTSRTLDEIDDANPRPNNEHGQIIEITEHNNDHAATTFTWEIFVLCGDPANGGTWYAGFDQDLVSPISAPDNLTFDLAGNIWISTDGNELEVNDGLYAAPTEGEQRGYVQLFFSAVPGAEVSGPVFNSDNTALFLSVQHPGEGGTFEEPLSQWPDGSGPARPSVVLVTADNGGPVGSA